MVFAALAPTILETVGEVIAQRLRKKNVPVVPEVIEQAAHEATQAIHEDPHVALVPVKSGWMDPTIWSSLIAFICAVLTAIFGRDVVPPEVQAQIVSGLLGIFAVFQWWHRRRSTSINAAAAVNVLKKPAKGA